MRGIPLIRRHLAYNQPITLQDLQDKHPKNFMHPNMLRMWKVYADIDLVLQAETAGMPSHSVPTSFINNSNWFNWQYSSDDMNLWTTLFPVQSREPQEAYLSRLKVSNHEDYFVKTLDLLFSRVTKKGFRIGTPPQQLEKFYKNVDGRGRTLEQFILDFLQDFVVRGMAFLHVIPLSDAESKVVWDHISATRTVTMQESIDGKIPIFCYNADMALNEDIQAETIGTVYNLLYSKDGSTWIDIFDEREKLKTIRLYSGGLNIFPVYIEKKSLLYTRVPYKELAKLNIQYSRISSNLHNMINVASSPMLWVGDVQDDTLEEMLRTGLSTRGITRSDIVPQYIEPKGSMVDAVFKTLESLKTQINSFGLGIAGDRPDRETSKSVSNAVELSISTFISYLSIAEVELNKILELTFKYFNVTFDKKSHGIELDSGIGSVGVDANQSQLLMTAIQNEVITNEQFIDVAKEIEAIPKAIEIKPQGDRKDTNSSGDSGSDKPTKPRNTKRPRKTGTSENPET